ncbi:hypothetical protein D3C80_1806020 [compost metagenome]
MHFGPVVTAIVELLGTHAATGKRWREIAAHLHLINERMLVAMADFQADAVIGRVRVCRYVQTLFGEHGRHFFNRRTHRRIEETVDLIPRREMHRLTQALAPTAPP